MKKIYKNTKILDSLAVNKYGIDNKILMENASLHLANFILKKKKKNSKIIFLTGSGDNGGDGFVAARILSSKIPKENIIVIVFKDPKSKLSLKQYDILKKLNCVTLKKHLNVLDFLDSKDILVDCIFGSGFKNRIPSKDDKFLISIFNQSKALKIACDIPSFLDSDHEKIKVDFTLSMGALNLNLFKNQSKDFVGKIKLVPLGISYQNYEHNIETPFFLLQKSDLILPNRKLQNTHKGTFGNSFILQGNIFGASFLAAKASIIFGSGKTHIVTFNRKILKVNEEVIYVNDFSNVKKSDCVCIGCGLLFNDIEYQNLFKEISNLDSNFVFDADILYRKELVDFILNNQIKEVILTPHPKELFGFLQNCKDNFVLDCEDIDKNLIFSDFQYMLQNILEVTRILSKNIPNVVFLVKGSNMIVAQNGKCFINPHAKNNLSKGGSGDVLSGLLTSLLAQGMSSLDSAKNSSLTLALASKIGYKKYSSYSFNCKFLIKIVAKL